MRVEGDRDMDRGRALGPTATFLEGRLLDLNLSGALLWSVLLVFFATLHFFGGWASAFFLLYWIMALFVPGVMYFDGKGRVLRSLPIDRREAGTLLWVSTVWIMPLLSLPLPLLLGNIRGAGPRDVLFFSVLVFTLSSSATLFLVATNFHVTGSAWIPSDVFGVRSLLFTRWQRKPWLLLGLGVLPLVVLIVHPAWRVAQSDWVHYALIGAAVFSLIPSYRMRACLWGDFMSASHAKAGNTTPRSYEIVFASRRRSRLSEWHRGAISMLFIMAMVILPISATWAWMGTAKSVRLDGLSFVWIAFILLPSELSKEWDSIRAYRMLPLSGAGLCLRLIYRIVVCLASLLIPADVLLLFRSEGGLLTTFCVALLGLGLSLVSGALMPIWDRNAGVLPVVLVALITPAHGFLGEMGDVIAATGLFLTVVGIVLYYVAITRCSKTYRPRTCRGTGEVKV